MASCARKRASSIALAALLLVLCAACETKFEMGSKDAPSGGAGAVPSAAGTSAVGASGGGAAPGAGGGGAPSTAGSGGAISPGGGGAGGAGAMGGTTSVGTAGAPDVTGDAGSGSAAGSGAEPMAQTCPASSALVPGETTETIQVGGVARRFILHVPASYDGQVPVPLVLDFHGILMNSSLQRAFSGFAALSDSEGFIVAYPEGTDTAFNVGICCTSSTVVDDVAFARGIVSHLSAQGCIDQKRVHSVGYSMGGGMSMHLACHAADVFASIAYSAFDMMPDADWPCTPSRPVAALAFRSTGDPLVPYAGAMNTIPPNGNPNLVTFIGAQANLTKWAGLDGCTGTPEDTGSGCSIYRQCASGVEVGLCTRQGGGHDYLDAATGWAFLKKHPMP
jgi:polyhydroxybutyrate depolymerase